MINKKAKKNSLLKTKIRIKVSLIELNIKINYLNKHNIE